MKNLENKLMFIIKESNLINLFDYVLSLNWFTPLGIKCLRITFFYGRTSINYMKL